MVTKRIRSEYMKKFKDPKWETYTKCYEEKLKYRLTRRLLEHSHNPWFWSGSDTDSDSGGRSPPPANQNQVQAETPRAGAEGELEECEGARMGRQQQQTAATMTVPRLPLPDESHTVSAVHGSQTDGAIERREAENEREKQRPSSRGSKHREPGQDRDTGPRPQVNKLSKQTWRGRRVRPAQTQRLKEDTKHSRHPFALYGSGEKDADISSRKTHNVGPAASTNEIHESALRAKSRREVERQVQTQKAERRRAKSADLDKARTKLVQPDFNPWLTEYMRCFSARSR